jgi:hypothetical protein
MRWESSKEVRMEEDKGMKWIKERKKQIILPIIDGS